MADTRHWAGMPDQPQLVGVGAGTVRPLDLDCRLEVEGVARHRKPEGARVVRRSLGLVESVVERGRRA